VRRIYKGNGSAVTRTQRRTQQTKFTYTRLLHKQVYKRRERPPTARQLSGQRWIPSVDNAAASVGELRSSPQRRMNVLRASYQGTHGVTKNLYGYTVSALEHTLSSPIFKNTLNMDERVRRPSSHPMPEIAAFVRSLRDAFGDDVIDRAISEGKSGEPSFYACENGRSVGTAAPSGVSWRVDESLRDRHFCPGCDGSCVAQGICCSVWRQRSGRQLAPEGNVLRLRGEQTHFEAEG
jgi:hypothetical protein